MWKRSRLSTAIQRNEKDALRSACQSQPGTSPSPLTLWLHQRQKCFFFSLGGAEEKSFHRFAPDLTSRSCSLHSGVSLCGGFPLFFIFFMIQREQRQRLLPQAVCEIWGPMGALWMAPAESSPQRSDHAHWEQVKRGRECFCCAFGPLTHCPASVLAALKSNIFICEALRREGGAAVRRKSSPCWQLHLLLKGIHDRRTMSLRQPALSKGLSYTGMLGYPPYTHPPNTSTSRSSHETEPTTVFISMFHSKM